MTVLLKNNVSSTLATAISPTDTGIVVASGSRFPTITSGDYFYVTLVSQAGQTEIVKVTARVGNSMTVVRAQDGSLAASFQVGALVDMRVNVASIADLRDEAAEITIADAGGYYTSGNVEGALQEAGAVLQDSVSRADVAALLADTVLTYTAGQPSTVATGDIVRTRAEGFAYAVAASNASNHHVTTVGGVKLYVQRVSGWYHADAFGIANDDVTEVSSSLQALFSIGGKIRLGKGGRYVINKRVTFPSNFELDFNFAQIRSQTSGYVRGTTPSQAAMLCPATIDTVDGSAFTENVLINGPGKVVHGSSEILTGLYLGAIKNFVVRGLEFYGQAGITNFTFGCIVNHAAQLGRIEDCKFVYTETAPTVGAFTVGGCGATRNISSSAAAFVNDITWIGNSFYKNNNSTDELYWHNGGSGICSNVRHIGNHFETGSVDATPSMVTVYNFSDNETITTSVARGSIWIGNSFKMRGVGVNYHMLLGFTGDVRPVDGIIVEGNTFDINTGTAIFQLSPVAGGIIQGNVVTANSGAGVTVTASLAGVNKLVVVDNQLNGSYSTAFSGPETVVGNFVESCTQFAAKVATLIDNNCSLVRLNFIETLSGPEQVNIRGNKFTVSSYAAGLIRATFYVSGTRKYVIENNTITYDSADSWQILYADATNAPRVHFKNNTLLLGTGAGGTKPSVQTFSTPLGGSGGNYLFDQWEDNVSTAFGFGISGYIPQIGHVQYLDDVVTGTSVAFARMRIAGAYRTISANVA